MVILKKILAYFGAICLIFAIIVSPYLNKMHMFNFFFNKSLKVNNKIISQIIKYSIILSIVGMISFLVSLLI